MSWLVLLVEDDDDIREALAGILSMRGFRVLEARNGQDAIDRVLHDGGRPAVILLDLLMPVMDGEEFLARQGQHPLLAGAPVILVTAQLMRPTQTPPTVRATFTKPVTLQQLLGAIQTICSDLRASSVHVRDERIEHELHADGLVKDPDARGE